MKTCTKCKRELPLEAFNKKLDGHQPSCRQCRRLYHEQHKAEQNKKSLLYYEKNKLEQNAKSRAYRGHTLRGFIASAWHHLNLRTINGSHPGHNDRRISWYLDKGVRLEMTRDEFAAWCAEQWPLIQQVRASGEVVSLDRIDSDGHYSLDNIRILSLSENSRLGGRRGREMQGRNRTLTG